MRSISQIYSEIVAVRNDYLQLTELNSGRSNSKLSILNLLTYVMAVGIHAYEAILDVFQVRIAEALVGRVNGTPDWYVAMAKRFQYNPANESGDELRFNDDTLKIEYITTEPGHRIVKEAGWEPEDGAQAIVLKVNKENEKSEKEAGVPYSPLSYEELTALRVYIQQIKFVGSTIYCQSMPGDILTVVADKYSPIFYDDSFITAAQALSNIQKSLVEYVCDLKYNSSLYYQGIVDKLQKTDHISDISSGLKIFITPYNYVEAEYGEPYELTSHTKLKSGFASLKGTDGIMTVNSTNIKLVPASQIYSYNPEEND